MSPVNMKEVFVKSSFLFVCFIYKFENECRYSCKRSFLGVRHPAWWWVPSVALRSLTQVLYNARSVVTRRSLRISSVTHCISTCNSSVVFLPDPQICVFSVFIMVHLDVLKKCSGTSFSLHANRCPPHLLHFAPMPVPYRSLFLAVFYL